MTGRRQLLCAVAATAATLARLGEAQEALYPLDIASVMCEQNSSTGDFNIRKMPSEVEVEVDIPSSRSTSTSVYVPTIYRTSGVATTVRLGLKDSSGLVIVPMQNFALAAVSGRRLTSQSEASGASGFEKDIQQAQKVGQALGTNQFHSSDASRAAAECEDVFLLDGRSPVDLPDTWAEAREAFRSVCELELGLGAENCSSEELDLFQGYPADSSAFNPEIKLCKRLVHAVLEQEFGAIALTARRLKSGGGAGTYSTAGGAPAAGAWTSSTRTGLPDYGYSTARLGSTYPRGYATTGLGYAGRTTAVPWRGSSRVAVLAGAGVGLGLFGAWRFRNYARSSTGGSVEDGDCDDPSAPCEWNLNVQDLVREDLMKFGFYPSKMRYPLKLTIADFQGADFNDVSRVCPPAGWNSSSTISWEQGNDIFFSLADASVLQEDEEDAGGAVGGILSCLFFFTAVCLFCRFRKRIPMMMKFDKLRKARLNEGPQPGVSSAVGLEPTIQGSLIQGEGDSVGVLYQLNISPQGYVNGTGTVNGNARQISGISRLDNPNLFTMRLQETLEDLTSEVELIMVRGDSTWEGTGSFITRWNGKCLAFSKGVLYNMQVGPTQQGDLQTVTGVVIGQPFEPGAMPTAVAAKTE